MNRIVALLFCAILAGCATTGQAPTPTEILYAASASLDQAEVVATVYAKSSIADPVVVAEIKALDNIAYDRIHPLVDTATTGGDVVSAVEASAAQAAVASLSQYMLQHGVK